LDEALWYTADWDIWLKLSRSGLIHYHDDVTIGFRIHGGSLTNAGSRNVDDFTQQMETVLNRHLPALEDKSNNVALIARASIKINAALAAAAQGDFGYLTGAASAMLRLGPRRLCRYLHDSRIIDRVAPRIRAKLLRTL
jgi:hypothetical protein